MTFIIGSMQGRMDGDRNDIDAEGRSARSDEALVDGIRRGDTEAVRLVIERYDRLVRYSVFRACRERCRTDPHWLDARASETWSGFVQSLRRLPAHAAPNDLPAYLAQIARNKCRDALRLGRALAERMPVQADADLSQVPDQKENTDEAMSRLEQLEALRSCIARLRPDDRRLCEQLELIAERRWAEAAQRLELAESTLRSRWPRVLERLRDCLAEKNR